MNLKVTGKRVALFTVTEKLVNGQDLSKKSQFCFIHTVFEVLVQHPGEMTAIFSLKKKIILLKPCREFNKLQIVEFVVLSIKMTIKRNELR